MKIKPEIFLLNEQEIKHKKILISGSDESLISFVTENLIRRFKKNNFHIDRSGSINKGLSGDLFSEKKILFLLKDFSIKKDFLELSNDYEQVILISCSNNKKINPLKSELTKSKESLVLDCYPLSRSSKEFVIKKFLEKNNVSLPGDIFWYVVENLEDEYVLLCNQLELISLYKGEIKTALDIEKIVFVENKIEINKIFFYIFKNNKALVDIFNKNIYSHSDFYVLLSFIKIYLGIISSSLTKEDALSKLPRYLFNERDFFLKMYNQLNKEKALKIYENIFKVERLMRKNSELYSEIGLRFLLNTRKIIVS